MFARMLIPMLAIATLLMSSAQAFQETPVPETAVLADWQAELTALVRDYETTFNAHEADKLGQLWLEQAVFHDRIIETKLVGREALVTAFKSLFETQPGVKIRLDVSELTKIKDDLATAEGLVTMYVPDEEPTYNAFSAVYIKEGDKWVIASAEEVAPSSPPGAEEALSELDWLLGEWSADLDAKQTATRELGNAKIVTTYRYSPTKTFLIRSFAMTSEESEEPLIQGTQIIGWDPRALQIRSWTFSSDGAFGEAFWSKSGEDWLIKTTQTQADGGAASGTYILTRLGENEISLSLIGQMVDGKPLPQADPIKLTRETAESAAAEEAVE